jgi:hypothetical protein
VLFGTTSPFIPQGGKGSQGVFCREIKNLLNWPATEWLAWDFTLLRKFGQAGILGAGSSLSVLKLTKAPLRRGESEFKVQSSKFKVQG